MGQRLSQVTGEKASPFSFSQLGTVPFPKFECLLWPPSSALYALIHSPKQQQREADSSSSRCLHRRGSHISWGWGKQHRSKKGSGGEKLSLLPFPKVPRQGQKARGCCLKADLVFLFLLKGLGLIFLWFFYFFKYRTSVLIQKFLWMLGVGKGSENIHCIFSPGFLVCSYVFQKGTKEKPHWDHNKSSVVLEEMRAYNLDKTRSGRRSMPKNPGTAERGEHPGASKAVFSSWLGMHVQLQYRSHCASRSPSPGTYNKQPGDSESLTHENTAVRVFLDGDFFFSCTAF